MLYDSGDTCLDVQNMQPTSTHFYRPTFFANHKGSTPINHPPTPQPPAPPPTQVLYDNGYNYLGVRSVAHLVSI